VYIWYNYGMNKFIPLLLLVIVSCSAKEGVRDIDWKKVIDSRLKDIVHKPTFIDMRWIHIPSEEKKEKAKEAKESEE